MNFQLLCADVMDGLHSLPAASVQTCVTSPPYWGLRDYGMSGQLGLERNPEDYVSKLIAVFREVRRVLRKDGTVWLNLGDSYSMSTRGAGGKGKQHSNNGSILLDRAWQISDGLKPKDLIGIPWRVAFALQADGWYLRSDIIWSKPNPMPESVTDRPTKAHEYLFLLAQAERYYYDAGAIAEQAIQGESFHGAYGKPGVLHLTAERNGRANGQQKTVDSRNKRSVWSVTTKSFPDAHFATFPEALVTPCILAGCPVDGMVLDPFCGAGTTGVVALRHGRHFIGIDLNPDYVSMARRRLEDVGPLFHQEQPAERPANLDLFEATA